MLNQEVKQKINTARQILVGKVPDPKAQVEQITTALIYNPNPLPPLEIQKQIVAEIEKEEKIVENLKELIKIYEEKIKDKISEVWGRIKS